MCFPWSRKNRVGNNQPPTTNKKEVQSPKKSMQKQFSLSGQQIITDIAVGRVVGEGNFGKVYMGDWNGTKVALKKLNHENLEAFDKEAALLCQLRHPHIVSFLGIFQDHEGEKYMVCEYLSKGSVQNILRTKRHELTALQLLNMAIDACKGMVYLETRKIVHRDLSVRNLLVDSKMQVKVSDFGLARSSIHSTSLPTANLKLPVRWTAPEVLQDGVSDTQSDVYSFGVVMWELFQFGIYPWWEYSTGDVLDIVCKGIEKLPQPLLCPDSLYKLMLSCWRMVKEERPTFRRILDLLKDIKREMVMTGAGAAKNRDIDLSYYDNTAHTTSGTLSLDTSHDSLYSMSPSQSTLDLFLRNTAKSSNPSP